MSAERAEAIPAINPESEAVIARLREKLGSIERTLFGAVVNRSISELCERAMNIRIYAEAAEHAVLSALVDEQAAQTEPAVVRVVVRPGTFSTLREMELLFDQRRENKARVALLERALHQIKNSCVDDGDTANELFRMSPAELRKIATDALAGIGDFAMEPETAIGQDAGMDADGSDRASVFAVTGESDPFAITSEQVSEYVIRTPDTVHAFPGHVCCSKCTQPMAFQERKTGETHAICWCPTANCEMHDVRLVLEAQPVVVRRFEG